MKVECIRHRDFENFLQSEMYLESEVLPISRHRGWSHFQNPKARPDDVLLILILFPACRRQEKNQLAAYLGILPDDIFCQEKKYHVGWLSCIWVSSKSRGKGFAKTLLENAWTQWDGNILMTEFTAPAKKLYDRTGNYEDLKIKNGARCYLRSNLHFLLPNKNPRYQKWQPLLKIFDGVFNFFNDPRLFFLRKNNPIISVVQDNRLDDVVFEFIQKMQSKNLTPKQKSDFDWMQEYPWLMNTRQAEEDQKCYHFSSFSTYFEFVFLKIFKDKKLIAVLVLAIREKALKIPFLYFEKSATEDVAQVVCNFMIEKKLCFLTFHNKTLTDFLKNKKSPFFLVRDFRRHYLISKKLKKKLGDSTIILQDGDGDCAFT